MSSSDDDGPYFGLYTETEFGHRHSLANDAEKTRTILTNGGTAIASLCGLSGSFADTRTLAKLLRIPYDYVTSNFLTRGRMEQIQNGNFDIDDCEDYVVDMLVMIKRAVSSGLIVDSSSESEEDNREGSSSSAESSENSSENEWNPDDGDDDAIITQGPAPPRGAVPRLVDEGGGVVRSHGPR